MKLFYGTTALKPAEAEMPWESLDDPRDPLPAGHCMMCGKYWHFCACAPDDPACQRRIQLERAMRDGDDITACELLGAEDDGR